MGHVPDAVKITELPSLQGAAGRGRQQLRNDAEEDVYKHPQLLVVNRPVQGVFKLNTNASTKYLLTKIL